MHDFGPPALERLYPVIHAIPREVLPWIAEKHVRYLDDRIHKINQLTDYLAGCVAVNAERKEFIEFVDHWTKAEKPDLDVYLDEYAGRFRLVRGKVEELCEQVMFDEDLWKSKKRLEEFWHKFTYINEIDSLHGMFLTSGRWYVNVMLPAVKELIYCSLPSNLTGDNRNEVAYTVARRIITPQFANTPQGWDHNFERQFTALFMPILQHYDRKILFLFEIMGHIPVESGITLGGLVEDVSENPDKWNELLEIGVYPPFAWHELHASRRSRREAPDLIKASSPLLAAVPPHLLDRARKAMKALDIFKAYELNYNNYNYKGRFGLVSKYQYWRMSAKMNENIAERFLDAILLDRFYEALDVVAIWLNTNGGMDGETSRY